MLAHIRALVPFDAACHRLVLVNPNASELLPHRRWMPERFAQLIRRILNGYGDVFVLITGAPDERAEAERLATLCGSRCASFAGHSALAELPALYSHAALMVTNDFGPAHFAAASGLPTVVLFGPEVAKSLSAARPLARDLCRACVFALRLRPQPSQDSVHR